MRPDPRLLLPASAVERVPEGGRVWVDGCDYPCVIVNGERALPGGGFLLHALNAYSVDLSAPVDGERLDALPWALERIHPDAVRVCRIGSGRKFAIIGPSGWPVEPLDSSGLDLSDLTPDDAGRVVVVATLVARGGARG